MLPETVNVKPKPHPKSQPRRPQGLPTRGKTAPGRLRGPDTLLALYDPGLIQRAGGPFRQALLVDLGFGAEPATTLEMADRLRRLNPGLPVLGVEIDPIRVEAALSCANALTFFRLGGFNLPLNTWPDGSSETVRAIRAFNVLRQYPEEAVPEAWAQMGSRLLPGGLLLEGTSNPSGSLWVANLLRRPEASPADAPLVQEAVAFGFRFSAGFDPASFQPVLPKNFIHRMVPGEPIHAFFEAWKQAARETAAEQTWGTRRWFSASADRLHAMGWQVEARRRWLHRGILLLRIPCGSLDLPGAH